jgi:hypothetical protein
MNREHRYLSTRGRPCALCGQRMGTVLCPATCKRYFCTTCLGGHLDKTDPGFCPIQKVMEDCIAKGLIKFVCVDSRGVRVYRRI